MAVKYFLVRPLNSEQCLEIPLGRRHPVDIRNFRLAVRQVEVEASLCIIIQFTIAPQRIAVLLVGFKITLLIVVGHRPKGRCWG